MRVSDLINVLGSLDPDMLVVLSKDPEGNDFSSVHTHEEGSYDYDYREFIPAEDSIDAGGVPCIVLVPDY